MKFKKSKINTILTVIFAVLLLMPQTRKPIQLVLNKVIALFGPSVSIKENAIKLSEYNWKLLDVEGNEFNLESTRGKVVFINSWATWCMPCVAELPSMQKLYQDYSDKIVFLFISSESMQTAKEFMERKEYTLPVFRPITAAPKHLNNRSIPTTYVIGKKGMIHVNKKGASNWNSKDVRALLDNLIAE